MGPLPLGAPPPAYPTHPPRTLLFGRSSVERQTLASFVHRAGLPSFVAPQMERTACDHCLVVCPASCSGFGLRYVYITSADPAPMLNLWFRLGASGHVDDIDILIGERHTHMARATVGIDYDSIESTIPAPPQGHIALFASLDNPLVPWITKRLHDLGSLLHLLLDRRLEWLLGVDYTDVYYDLPPVAARAMQNGKDTIVCYLKRLLASPCEPEDLAAIKTHLADSTPGAQIKKRPVDPACDKPYFCCAPMAGSDVWRLLFLAPKIHRALVHLNEPPDTLQQRAALAACRLFLGTRRDLRIDRLPLLDALCTDNPTAACPIAARLLCRSDLMDPIARRTLLPRAARAFGLAVPDLASDAFCPADSHPSDDGPHGDASHDHRDGLRDLAVDTLVAIAYAHDPSHP